MSGGAFWIWGIPFFNKVRSAEWAVDSLYAAIFDVSSIVCAFLFSFLVFIRTTENTFLSGFRTDKAYSIMNRHFLMSISGSFLLTLYTVPLLVVVPCPVATMQLSFWVLLIWWAFVGYVVAATFRSGYQFLAVLDAAYNSRFKDT